MAKKNHKFINLSAKIKMVRESLGLSQEELGLRLTPKRTRGAVAQWEMEDDRRTEPSMEQLHQIAHMTDRPRHYISFFLHDAIAAHTYVEYYQDGAVRLMHAEDEPDEEEMHRLFEEHQKEEDEIMNGPAQGWIAIVEKDPKAMEAGFRYYRELYPPETKTARSVSAKPFFDDPIEEGLKPAPVNLHDAVDGILRKSQEEDNLKLFSSRAHMFQISVRHFLSFYRPEADRFHEARLGKGSIRVAPYFWDGRTLIEFKASRMAEKRLRIEESLAQIFLMEKLIGRAVRKMLVVCSDHPAPNSSPLILEDVNSCKMMGVHLLIAHPSNPQRTAEVISGYLGSNAEDPDNTPYYVPAIAGLESGKGSPSS